MNFTIGGVAKIHTNKCTFLQIIIIEKKTRKDAHTQKHNIHVIHKNPG